MACLFLCIVFGTTNLHLDVADAINLMPWTLDASRPGAVWTIFPAGSAEKIAQFAREQDPQYDDKDPIQSHTLFLDDHKLRLLEEKYSVKAWKIEQYAGDAVVIPAGCAHQVDVQFLSCKAAKLTTHTGDQHSERN